MRSIKRIIVKGLFNSFDHQIDFPEHSSFVVLHGPNGVGKTKLLELAQATLVGDFTYFTQLTVHSVEFNFGDNSWMQLQKPIGQAPFDPNSPDYETESGFQVTLCASNGDRYSWSPFVQPDRDTLTRARYVLEHDYRAKYLGARRWRLPNGELIVGTEALLQFLRFNPRMGNDPGEEAPAWVRDFFSESRVHLIETQRLHQLQGGKRSEEGRHSRSTVSEFSGDMGRRIAEVLAANSRTSQQLDRSFPRRILTSASPPPEITEEIIREKYRRQIEKREALEDVAILEDQEDLALPAASLKDWERRVLWIYLDDAEKKLATFDDILSRATLLRDIVNSRFLNKQLFIDRNTGFYLRSDTGDIITPDQLSSGEQHEVVLMYDLLFNVSPNSLVMIDEPEISLHVGWQRKFLADIERIAELVNLQFIIATHSPQIVHKWWDRTVQLGPGVDD